MKRENMMTTYHNLIQMHKSFEAKTVTVDPAVIDYANRHGKKAAYLFNNRILAMYVNPSQLRKDEYTANWNYINSL